MHVPGIVVGFTLTIVAVVAVIVAVGISVVRAYTFCMESFISRYMPETAKRIDARRIEKFISETASKIRRDGEIYWAEALPDYVEANLPATLSRSTSAYKPQHAGSDTPVEIIEVARRSRYVILEIVWRAEMNSILN